MGVKMRERRGAWWLIIDFKDQRKAKRVGEGKQGKKAAELAGVQIQAKLASSDASVFDETRAKALTFQEHAEGWLKN